MGFEAAEDLAAMFDVWDGFAKLADYRAGGTGAAASVAVLLSQADAPLSAFGRSLASAATLLSVQVANVPNLAAGDTFTVAGVVYTVQGAPLRDETRAIWRAEAAAA